MDAKRVVISMVEGLFLFLALEAIGKLSGFLPSNTQEISAGVLLIGVAYSFTVNFLDFIPRNFVFYMYSWEA